MIRRALVLGTTGVDKRGALDRLLAYRETHADISNLVVKDFEQDYVKKHTELHGYLDVAAGPQKELWRKAWQDCIREIDELQDKVVILLMHGVLVRPLYGTRSAVDIAALRAFQPDILVTLIDDVYTQWYRTEHRATELGFRGRPSLAELLDARRDETFLGDILASNLGSEGSLIPHFLLAVHHHARTLDRLLFGPPKRRTVYLSFPISGPRRKLKDGDTSGIEETNAFLQRANDFDKESGNSIFFCPLTIDELPLVQSFERADQKGGATPRLPSSC